MQHHEIDTSTLRLDDDHPSRSARRPRSASTKQRSASLKKGFLRSSSNTLNIRPHTQKNDFDDSTTDNEQLRGTVQMANKHRLLLGNEHDLAQVLNEQFPGIYVSSEMQSKLNDQFSKHIDNLFKSRMELLNAQQGNINDVRTNKFSLSLPTSFSLLQIEATKQKHDQTTEILRKELGALQRQVRVETSFSDRFT